MFKKPDLVCLVQDQIDEWRGGEQPDAAAFLDAHPELQGDKSLAIDLICEEYRLRTAAGDTIVKSTFCDRFPAYRQSVAKMIEVQEFLDQCPQFAVQPHDCQWPHAGDRFLGFEIVELLGTGGLARVYLAREPALGGRLVVIKVSRFGGSEAATLGRLSHANIVPVHSVKEDKEQGWTAICMPFLGTATALDLLDAARQARAHNDGSLISRVARASRLSELSGDSATGDEGGQWNVPFATAIVRFVAALAEGLHAAHIQGIFHRDLKPSNVLLAWSGRPMLLDFNLSTDLAIENFRVGGTLAYMAPEQIEALARDPLAAAQGANPQADIYSLGALLYELLTGRLPAQPADADHLPLDAYQPWLACKSATLPSLAEGDSVDPRLAAIVLKCLAIRPSDRYATAAELAADLSELQQGPPAPRSSQSTAPARRIGLRGWLTVAALVTTIAVILSRSGLLDHRPAVQPTPAPDGNPLDKPPAVAAPTEPSLERPTPDSLYRRFWVHYGQRDLPAAHMVALELSQWNRAAGLALAGWCSYELGNPRLAREELDAAYIAGCRRHEIQIRLAETWASLDDFELALIVYDLLLKTDPDDVQALRGRIFTRIKSATKNGIDLPAQALIDAERLESLAPDSPDAMLAAFRAYDHDVRQEGGLSPVAAECLQRLLEHTDDPAILKLGDRYAYVVERTSIGPALPRPINELSPRLLKLPSTLRLEDLAAPLTARH